MPDDIEKTAKTTKKVAKKKRKAAKKKAKRATAKAVAAKPAIVADTPTIAPAETSDGVKTAAPRRKRAKRTKLAKRKTATMAAPEPDTRAEAVSSSESPSPQASSLIAATASSDPAVASEPPASDQQTGARTKKKAAKRKRRASKKAAPASSTAAADPASSPQPAKPADTHVEPTSTERTPDSPSPKPTEVRDADSATSATDAVEAGSPLKSRPRRRGRRGRRGRRSPDPTAATGADGDVAAKSADDAAIVTPDIEPVSTSTEIEPAARSEPDKTDTKPATDDAPSASSSDRPARGSARRGRRGRGGRPSKSDQEAQPPAAQDGGSQASTATAIAVDDRAGEPKTAQEDAEEAGATTTPSSPRQMLINVSNGVECRIAVLHEGRLEELFMERESSQSHVGNIYKGKITNVEPAIQAVFVDFGLSKNGFLHISDVQPQYFPNHKGQPEEVGRKIPRHNRPPIQKCFRRGQEVIVQVSKEGVGTKGPTLTTYLSIPGRFLVMMPGMSRQGVSRRIEDEDDRRSMRDTLRQLELPADMGFILRTAGLDQTKRELQRDLNYLLRLWKSVVQCVKTLPSPAELYRETDLVTRTIRDIYTSDYNRLIVDDEETRRKAEDFLRIVMPRSKAKIELYTDREPLFHRYHIEDEIDQINRQQVPLPSGGSLVIESTEALVAIDVNSGRMRNSGDAEETALRTDVEAAREIARQLRLRDLGGLIVCDFIDLRLDRNKRTVERTLRDALKAHKERAHILRMNAFGLIEMTRQRQGPSMKRNTYFNCPHCEGRGLVKMPESVSLDVLRTVQLAAHHDRVQKVTITVASEVAFELLNLHRTVLAEIESETGKTVIIRGKEGYTTDQMDVACEDARQQPFILSSRPASRPSQRNR